MDFMSIFEQKLKSKEEPLETSEKNWDKRAETFYHNQVHGSTFYPTAVTQLLEQKGILTPSARVLDIGSGSGRYAIPFAKICQSVHALDLSSEMLQFLQKEMKKYRLTNIYPIKSAWPTSERLGEFDVAFAAMCPATRSIEAIKEMSNSASEYGVICQFTESTDNIIETLKKHQLLVEEDIKGPHNDRSLLQSYFNILWELGFNPEISYLHDTFEMYSTKEEAFHSYSKRFEQLNLEKLENVLEGLQVEKEQIQIMKKTTLAVLSWKTAVEK